MTFASVKQFCLILSYYCNPKIPQITAVSMLFPVILYIVRQYKNFNHYACSSRCSDPNPQCLCPSSTPRLLANRSQQPDWVMSLLHLDHTVKCSIRCMINWNQQCNHKRPLNVAASHNTTAVSPALLDGLRLRCCGVLLLPAHTPGSACSDRDFHPVCTFRLPNQTSGLFQWLCIVCVSDDLKCREFGISLILT